MQRQQLVDWASQAEPNECCGLLLGCDGIVEMIELTANVAEHPTCEFEIDPAALIAAEKLDRTGKIKILGYFHSHPNGVAEPSRKDAQMAAIDGRRWLIIAGGEIMSWRPTGLADGNDLRFAPEGLV